MQVFDTATKKTIENKFYAYFSKKRTRVKISLKDAEKLVDYASWPAPRIGTMSAMDVSQGRVSGGGRRKPSRDEVDAIFSRCTAQDEWDELFDDLMDRTEDDQITQTIILVFCECLPEETVCEMMHVSHTAYTERKSAILCKAGILAVQKGLLEY